MKSIHLLDSDTINKIAAGEVVERPSSVIKELVENAIDAKASAITIEIKEGGIAMMRVTDNGGGIDRDDIKTAFVRHATSKIETAMDLMTVGSLGFRGEALSSIASVSQIELITKVHRELLGVRYCIDGGEEKSCDDIGCPDGTTIIVRNLFYNTPARRKFLKTAATEAAYINDLAGRLALSFNVSLILCFSSLFRTLPCSTVSSPFFTRSSNTSLDFSAVTAAVPIPISKSFLRLSPSFSILHLSFSLKEIRI